jgi:hypothetical protein
MKLSDLKASCPLVYYALLIKSRGSPSFGHYKELFKAHHITMSRDNFGKLNEALKQTMPHKVVSKRLHKLHVRGLVEVIYSYHDYASGISYKHRLYLRANGKTLKSFELSGPINVEKATNVIVEQFKEMWLMRFDVDPLETLKDE